MKLTPSIVVSSVALVVASAALYAIPKAVSPSAATPREFSNTDWVDALPKTPAAFRFVPLPESLELTGYSGFRLFARLPKIEVQPGRTLYYLHGTNTYEGPPNKLRLVRGGLGMVDVIKAGGGEPLSDLPEGFEYTVFFRRDGKELLSGFERFGFVHTVHGSRVTGGWPFTMRVPADAVWGTSGGNFFEIALGKEVEFTEWTFTPMTADGHQDDEHAVTVKWYFAFQIGPTAR